MARGGQRDKAAIAQRQTLVLQLRQDGWSYRAIGEKIGISYVQAHKDMKAALAELHETNLEATADYVALELARLDMLTKGLEPMARVGDPASVNAYMKVMDQRAKLLGLYAPTKVDANVTGTMRWEDVVKPDDNSSDPFT